ncbi:MAG: polysaccharide deacetylase family protein [Coriobacteriia bacterium]
MRDTLLVLFATLLLLPIGCSSSAGSKPPTADKAAAEWRSDTGTYTVSGSPGHTRRPEVPDWAIPYEKKLIVGVVTDRPAVALTIDDVGAKEMKPLVDALVANGLRATLFCVGSEMTTEAATYAAANGIELANHSWEHKPIGWFRPAAANEQIMRTNRLLHAGTGEWPIWYRAPFQNYQSNGMKAAVNAGMLVAGVSNDPLDYHGYKGDELVKRLNRRLKPGQIILLHKLPGTIATIPALADELKRRNATTLTLSQLAQLGPPATSAWQLEPLSRFFPR